MRTDQPEPAVGGSVVSDEWMMPEDDGWELPEESDPEANLPGYLKTPPHVGRAIGILAEKTGKSLEEVAAACERDNFMSAQEAMAFGLIDKVIANH